MERAERTSLIAGILSLAGGAALVVATFLRWISATIDRVGPGGIRRPGFAPEFPRPGQAAPPARSLSAQGIDLPIGKMALIAGIVLIATGFVLWLASGAGPRLAMGIVGLVAGTAAASLVLYRVTTVLNGGVLGPIQVASRSIGAGMVVALLGALSGIAGSILALAGAPKYATGSLPPGRSDVPLAPRPGSEPDGGATVHTGPTEPVTASTEPVVGPQEAPAP